MHVAKHVVPGSLRAQTAGPDSRDRLYVGGDPPFDPVVTLRNRWEPEVDHLMRQDPVLFEIGQGRVPAHRDPARRSTITEAPAV